MAPELAQFEREYNSRIAIVEVNTDEEQKPEFRTYRPFKKSGYIPETLVVHDGKLVYMKVGLMHTKEMEQAVDDLKAGKKVPSDLTP